MLEQLLVRALGEEGADARARARARRDAASMLVTFNGKSFDMPLLRTRFVMARRRAPPKSRRTSTSSTSRGACTASARRAGHAASWRSSATSSASSASTTSPSGDVSACYLHFLRTGDARALLGVVEHNAWDVVAMAALVGLYGEPRPRRARRRGPRGRRAHACGAPGRSSGQVDVAELAVARAAEGEAAPLALRARADIAKARGDRARARSRTSRRSRRRSTIRRVRLELAKLYEHGRRRPRVRSSASRRAPARRPWAPSAARTSGAQGAADASGQAQDARVAEGGEGVVEDRQGVVDVPPGDHERRRDAQDVAVEAAAPDEQAALLRLLEEPKRRLARPACGRPPARPSRAPCPASAPGRGRRR